MKRKLGYSIASFFVFLLIGIQVKAQPSFLMKDTTVTTQEGILFDNGGDTANYSNGLNSTFVINVGPNKLLKLSWKDFLLENRTNGLNISGTNAQANPCNDFVEVYDGTVAAGELKGSYCGAEVPETFTSVSGIISIRLVSNANNNQRGFEAEWSLVNELEYCDASGAVCGTAGNWYISEVLLGTTTYVNNTDCNTTLGRAYSDYRDSIFNVTSITPVTGTISTVNTLGTETINIYVDWNNNGSFDDQGEMTSAIPTGTAGIYPFVLTPPTGEEQGFKRMRLRLFDPILGTAIPPVIVGACGDVADGEVEDYTIYYTELFTPIPTCANGLSPVDNDSTVCIKSSLIWNTTEDVTGYRVGLRNVSTGTVLFQDSLTTDTSIYIGNLIVPGQTYRYIVIPVNDNGPAVGCDSITFQTNPNSDPNVEIFPVNDTLTTCNGINLGIEAGATGLAAPFTYTWSGNNIAYLNKTDTISIIFNSTANTETFNKYIVTARDSNNCFAIDSVVVHTINPPVASIPVLSNDSVCAGAKIQIQVASADEILEDSSATASWTVSNAVMLSPTSYESQVLVETISFRTRASNLACTVFSTASTVTVLALPSPPLLTINGLTTLCEGDSTALEVNNYGENLLWNTGETTLLITVNTSGSYSVSYTDNFGCMSVSAPEIITVNLTPAKPVVSLSSSNICLGDTLVLTATGSDITWNDAASTTGNALNTTINGAFVAISTNAALCSSVSDTVFVEFKVRPAKPTVTVIGNLSSCSNEAPLLVSSYPDNNLWNDSLFTSNDTLQVLTSGAYQVSYTAPNGCSATSDLVFASITPSPEKPVIAQLGDSLMVNNASGLLYNWFDAAGNLVQSSANPFLASPLGAKFYYLVVVSPEGCSSMPSDSIRFSSTGISSLSMKTLNVYPNPSNGFIVVENPLTSDVSMQIFDLTGKLVYTTLLNTGNNQLNLILSAGTYNTLVLSKDSVYRSSIVINK